jgi:hypothetical protein
LLVDDVSGRSRAVGEGLAVDIANSGRSQLL